MRPQLTGILGTALLCAVTACGSEAPRSDGPHILLITADTLRADHLGSYGHGPATSPFLDRLADEGVRFERAVSPAPWTLPSLTSIHTGLYPSEHGAVHSKSKVSPVAPLLAVNLQAAGYRTLAVVSHTYASHLYGLDQGFDRFADGDEVVKAEVSSRLVTERALELLDEALELGHGATEPQREAPIFLWTHYFDPHSPFVRHTEFGFADDDLEAQLVELRGLPKEERITELTRTAVMAHTRDIYDEEIAFTDTWIEVLVEGFRDRIGAADLVIAFTADHGEHFDERGFTGHGRDLYRQNLHVPLILSGSIPEAFRGLRVGEPVETVRLAATLVELAGATWFTPHACFYIEPSLLSDTGWGEEPCFSERHEPDGSVAETSIVLGNWKLIRGGTDRQLYANASDPGEQDDRAGSERPAEAEAQVRLEALLNGFDHRVAQSDLNPAGPQQPNQMVELEQGDLDHLRGLGYAE